jgi:maltose O-acetyltransferase
VRKGACGRRPHGLHPCRRAGEPVGELRPERPRRAARGATLGGVTTSRRRQLVLLAAALPVLGLGARARVLRAAGVRVGRGVQVSPGFVVGGIGLLTIGDEVFANHDVYVDTEAPVTIGDRVLLGDHVRLVTGTHEIGGPERRGGAVRGAPVTIGDGSWLGSGVTVLPGVTVGRGCVIGAGAVVTRDCAPDGLYVGVPARRVRDLDPAGPGEGGPVRDRTGPDAQDEDPSPYRPAA